MNVLKQAEAVSNSLRAYKQIANEQLEKLAA